MEHALPSNGLVQVEDVLSPEDHLQLEIARLRLKLDRAYADLKLAEERASLQRIHIAQLQNKLSIGVCKELPPFGVCREMKQKPKPAPKRLAKQAPFDPERAKKGLCQNPYCANKTDRRYCTHSCAMKHRWDNSKGA